MRDEILAFGACFDWISPILAVVQDLAHGGSHTFMVPFDYGWSGREIALLLRKHGVGSWGHMVINKTICLSVNKSQARWAQVVLDREGIPIESGRVAGSQPGQVGQPSGRRRATTRDILSDIWNAPSMASGSRVRLRSNLARRLGHG